MNCVSGSVLRRGWFPSILTVGLLAGVAAAQSGPAPTIADPPAAARGDALLRHIPDDAGVVIIIPSLDRLVDGLRAFGRASGLTGTADPTPREVLDALLNETIEHGAGIDTSGTFVIAARPADRPRGVLIAPLADAAAWMRQAGATERGGQLTVAVRGETWFAAVEAQVLLLSADESELIAARGAGGRYAARLGATPDELTNGEHVVVLVEVGAWEDQIQRGIVLAEELVRFAVMTAAGPDAPPARELWDWGFDELRGLSARADSLRAAFRAGDDGLRLSVVLGLAPESGAGRHPASRDTFAGDPLRGLPNVPFAVAFGAQWGPAAGGAARPGRGAELLLRAVLAALAGGDADRVAWDSAVARAVAAGRSVNGVNALVSPLRAGPGLLIFGSCATNEPRRVLSELAALLAARAERTPAFAGGEAASAPSSDEAGAGAHVVCERIGSNGDDAADAPTQRGAAARAVFGDAATLCLAAREGDVVLVLGPESESRERIARSLSPGAASLRSNARVAEALAALPPSPRAILLVDAARLITLSARLARTLGAARVPPIEVDAPHTPLIALGVYVDGAAVRAELCVPAGALADVLSVFRPGAAAARNAQ